MREQAPHPSLEQHVAVASSAKHNNFTNYIMNNNEMQHILSKWSGDELSRVLHQANGNYTHAINCIIEHERTGLPIELLISRSTSSLNNMNEEGECTSRAPPLDNNKMSLQNPPPSPSYYADASSPTPLSTGGLQQQLPSNNDKLHHTAMVGGSGSGADRRQLHHENHNNRMVAAAVSRTSPPFYNNAIANNLGDHHHHHQQTNNFGGEEVGGGGNHSTVESLYERSMPPSVVQVGDNNNNTSSSNLLQSYGKFVSNRGIEECMQIVVYILFCLIMPKVKSNLIPRPYPIPLLFQIILPRIMLLWQRLVNFTNPSMP